MRPMTARETELIRRAAAGDREAFDGLLAPRWERIFRIALRIVGHWDEAQDVAQQACLRLWEKLGRFELGEDLDGWIYRIVANLSIDALRRRRARPEAPMPEELASSSSPALHAKGASPEARVLARELERALEVLTAALPPRQKAVFVLSRVEGLSAAEIARVLSIAPSTVRNHLFQLRVVLARGLKERFPGLLGTGEGADDD